ncbi:hypothetical protein [Methylobacterium sp. R2-1]|uniref:hypothetical protein n=1 Tax=Methylobacterium sp. R2-1 TaxID=2587064 RepID=UPI001614DAE8|nr:hypothetical protein [Methylobacterium sp. R2-1]MBB2964106.1 hypothetical protein [Methylobacterium sp. R2-1]
MLRTGLLLGVSVPAAILTLILVPVVRQEADAMGGPTAPRVAYETPATPLPGTRPYSTALYPIHVATAPRPSTRTETVPTRSAQEELPAKPRRLTKEGCEAPLSSLVGPEARRMVPGRCMT